MSEESSSEESSSEEEKKVSSSGSGSSSNESSSDESSKSESSSDESSESSSDEDSSKSSSGEDSSDSSSDEDSSKSSSGEDSSDSSSDEESSSEEETTEDSKTEVKTVEAKKPLKTFVVKKKVRVFEDKLEEVYIPPPMEKKSTESGCVKSFALPTVPDNKTGWGPISGDASPFSGHPFAAFNRADRIARLSDFTGSSRHRSSRYGPTFGESQTFAYKEALDEKSFSLVDRGPKKKKSNRFIQRRQWNPNMRNVNRQRKRRTGWNNNRRRWGHQFQQTRKEPSVQISEAWELLKEVDFSDLPGNGTIADGKDLVRCGVLKQYSSRFDRILPKTSKVLQTRNLQHFTATTSADPVLQRLMQQKAGNVFATDTIIGALMACKRSNQAWDIVITKKGGQIVLDKRPNSMLDWLTVNENASDPQPQESGSINHPIRLSKEATYISRTYSQQCLEEGTDASLGEKNPFLRDVQAGQEPAAEAYRYRQFLLNKKTMLVVRTTVNAYVPRADGKRFVGIRALNQFDTTSGNVDWRQKLDSQSGSIMATEVKNNSNKVTRWIAEMHLAGCHEFRLGFVSRKHATDPYKHNILMSKRWNTLQSFATLARVRFATLWGSLAGIIETIQGLPDGKFLMMREPNEPKLQFYQVPEDAFDGESGDPFKDGAE